jgi:hypothetical protein
VDRLVCIAYKNNRDVLFFGHARALVLAGATLQEAYNSFADEYNQHATDFCFETAKSVYYRMLKNLMNATAEASSNGR